MIQIREYTENDIPALEKLMEDFQTYLISIDPKRKSIEGLGYGKLKIAEMVTQVTEKQGEIFVACNNTEVIGFGACTVEVPSKAQLLENPVLKYGSFIELFVDEKYRGAHIGKQIVQAMEDFLRSVGCDCVDLTVVSENNRAKKFYESNGYAVCEYVMGKDL
jgi:ribosomal protein S18 acetylase RimI-like enzyme